MAASILFLSLSFLPFPTSSQQRVDEEVDGGVEDDERVRDVLEPHQPVRPPAHLRAVLAVQELVEGRDQLPHVAEDEQPDDRHGDPEKKGGNGR